MIGKTLGHYLIRENLGEGCMGVAYKAPDAHIDHFAALKRLPATNIADAGRKRHIVQEAKAASLQNHAKIVHSCDIDQAEGLDCIAVEYVAGQGGIDFHRSVSVVDCT